MPASPVCCIANCSKRHYAKGFCQAHYERSRRHGDPLAGRTAQGEPEKFLREVVLPYDGDECLLWPFARSRGGYGKIAVNSRLRTVSRLICEDAHGPPPTAIHEAAHSCGKGHLGCVTKSTSYGKPPLKTNETGSRMERIPVVSEAQQLSCRRRKYSKYERSKAEKGSLILLRSSEYPRWPYQKFRTARVGIGCRY